MFRFPRGASVAISMFVIAAMSAVGVPAARGAATSQTTCLDPNATAAATAAGAEVATPWRFAIPIRAGYQLTGEVVSLEADRERDLARIVADVTAAKARSLDGAGVDRALASADLDALRQVGADDVNWIPAVTAADGCVPLPQASASPAASASGPVDDGVSVEAPAAAASIPCPAILQGNPFFPVCPKDYLDRNGWAPDHGYWDYHWFSSSTGTESYVLYMYTTWSSWSRLTFLRNGGNNTGFEINTAAGTNDGAKAGLAAAANRFTWWSDYPGAYIETIEFDDDTKTWAVGTDQGENLVAGRQYQSGMWLDANGRFDGLDIDLYGQVDLDMISNGDAGFFSDQACCFRSMRVGNYQSW